MSFQLRKGLDTSSWLPSDIGASQTAVSPRGCEAAGAASTRAGSIRQRWRARIELSKESGGTLGRPSRNSRRLERAGNRGSQRILLLIANAGGDVHTDIAGTCDRAADGGVALVLDIDLVARRGLPQNGIGLRQHGLVRDGE